jgi:hypothetical protein
MSLTSNELLSSIINYPGLQIVYKTEEGEIIDDLTIERAETKFIIKKEDKNE